MNVKKSIKKTIRSLPKSMIKEHLKLIWYNILADRRIKYKFFQKEGLNVIYETIYEDLTFFTNEPLYAITPDLDHYQHFYKVKQGDIVIDGDANVGILGMLFSKKVGDNGFVYCFEPDRYNVDELNSNSILNTHLDNYSVHKELLWREAALVGFQEAGPVASSVEGCRAIIEKYRPNFAIASHHFVDGKPTYLKLEEFFRQLNYPYITKRFGCYEIINLAGPSL
ncbi:FkbM family methyltransferase [Gelidibacter salicanalis]|uniref:FkbM family methyltransferase n=1 Tax=Gelidibacter salicanalis TaxID=291193 RepID=A0A934KK61_9FLAO|nr:FkbM family methyltransferase [Gelidibacter salicanalis]MBJ7880567.1 FkbM family methyltransferase [Gelidibacter salicanalis]